MRSTSSADRHDDYATRALMNRPTASWQLGAEVRRLARAGLKPRDISVALKMSLTDVLEALRGRESVA